MIERGRPVKDAAKRSGVSEHGPCKCIRAARPASKEQSELAKARLENQKLRAENRRLQEERVLAHSDRGSQYGSDDWRRFY
jgi:hypothetical protein